MPHFVALATCHMPYDFSLPAPTVNAIQLGILNDLALFTQCTIYILLLFNHFEHLSALFISKMVYVSANSVAIEVMLMKLDILCFIIKVSALLTDLKSQVQPDANYGIHSIQTYSNLVTIEHIFMKLNRAVAYNLTEI